MAEINWQSLPPKTPPPQTQNSVDSDQASTPSTPSNSGPKPKNWIVARPDKRKTFNPADLAKLMNSSPPTLRQSNETTSSDRRHNDTASPILQQNEITSTSSNSPSISSEPPTPPILWKTKGEAKEFSLSSELVTTPSSFSLAALAALSSIALPGLTSSVNVDVIQEDGLPRTSSTGSQDFEEVAIPVFSEDQALKIILTALESQQGLELKDRKTLLKKFKNCFAGKFC
jgi:hypothetical protein